MIRYTASLVVMMLLVLAQSQAGVLRREVRVTAPNAGVYDAPRATAEVIGGLSRGVGLMATGRSQGDWLEVEAPASVSGWIYGELLQEDRVAASSVKIRSGPGVEFSELGVLRRDDQVRRKGSRGGWVEFEGSPAMLVWIERSMVSAPAVVNLAVTPRSEEPTVAAAVVREERPSAPAVEEALAAAPPHPVVPSEETRQRAVVPTEAERRAVTVVAVPPPRVRAEPRVAVPVVAREPAVEGQTGQGAVQTPVARRRIDPVPVRRGVVTDAVRMDPASAVLPRGWRTVGSAPQGQSVVLTGVVRPSGFGFFVPTDYRLIQSGDRQPGRTVAFLYTSGMDLSGQVGHRVTLEGRRYWLIGVREPVIVLGRIR